MGRDWSRYEIILKARREGKTLDQAGALLDRTHERARQMEAKIICAIADGLPVVAHLAPLSERELAIFKRYRRPPNDNADLGLLPQRVFAAMNRERRSLIKKIARRYDYLEPED